jgi:hypothetical protein
VPSAISHRITAVCTLATVFKFVAAMIPSLTLETVEDRSLTNFSDINKIRQNQCGLFSYGITGHVDSFSDPWTDLSRAATPDLFQLHTSNTMYVYS